MMENNKENIALIKSEDFGVKIINLYPILKNNHAPYPIIEQITKSGTSIGANLNEALCAISKNDFKSKVYISYKESSETKYWLRLLYKTKYISEDIFNALYHDCDELYKMLSATTKTLEEKDRSKKSKSDSESKSESKSE